MNVDELSKIIDKKENKIYKKYFYNSKDLNKSIFESLKNDGIKIVQAYFKFNLVLNCLLRAEKENLFEEDIKSKLQTVAKVCYYFDYVYENLEKVFVKD